MRMKNMYLIFLLMVSLSVGSTIIWGQTYVKTVKKETGTVTGTVKTMDDSRLPGVLIWISGTSLRTLTNEEGRYILHGIPTVGTVLLKATLEGFDTDIQAINVNIGQTITQNFTLKLEELTYEVVVAPKMPKLMTASSNIGKLSFSPEEIAALPGLGERDIFRSMQLMPGISGSNESSAGLYVRGGTPDKNLILYDGFTVYHVDHFFGVFSAFNPNAIQDVTLYKGGFESKHGGRLSSVMEITGKTGENKGWNVGGGISLLSYNGMAEVPLGKNGTLLLTGRKSFASPLYKSIFDQYSEEAATPNRPGGGGGRGGGKFAAFESEPDSYFYDLNAKLTYKPSNKDVVFFSFFNGQDDLDNSLVMETPDFLMERGITLDRDVTDVTDWGNLAASFTWHRQWNDTMSTHAVVGYSNFYNTRENNVKSEITRDGETRTIDRESLEDNDVKDLTIRLDNVFRFGNSNQLDFGFQITSNKINYIYHFSDVENGLGIPGRGIDSGLADILNRSDSGTTWSAYLQDRMTLFGGFTITPGIRWTHFDVTGENYYEPRLSFIMGITENIKLKGAWGKYYQFVNKLTREDNAQGNREFWALADNGTIPIGSSIHYIAGLSYEKGDFLLDIEGYYKELDGLSEFALRFAPQSGEVNFDDYFFQGTGIARGIEVLLQKKFGKYTGWLSYTLGNVEYDFPVYGDETFPASHDVTHEVKLVGSFKQNNWTFGGTFILATGRPYTEPTGFEEITLPNDRVIQQVVYGDKNTARLPAYLRLDLSASYDLKLWNYNARLGLSIFNVLGRSNVWRKEFEVLEGEIVENNVTYMGFTPNLSFTIYLK